MNISAILISLFAIGELAKPTITQVDNITVDSQESAIYSTIITLSPPLPKLYTYSCKLGADNITLYTVMRSRIDNKTFRLITWRKENSPRSGYTLVERCRIVANRFQHFDDAGRLEYISTGKMEGQPIICISNSSGECEKDGLLITLSPKDDPHQVLQVLKELLKKRIPKLFRT